MLSRHHAPSTLGTSPTPPPEYRELLYRQQLEEANAKLVESKNQMAVVQNELDGMPRKHAALAAGAFVAGLLTMHAYMKRGRG